MGFSFIKKIAKDWDVKLRKKRYLSKIAVVERNRSKVLLAMPQTYMNNSGLAVKQLVEQGGIRPECLIVVYDDLDIPLGEIRIRKEGGAGSHKGMDSVVKEVHSTRFSRIRVGIGPLPPEFDAVDYVLSPFDEKEKPVVEQSLSNAKEALEFMLAGGVERAMNLFNIRARANLD